MFDEEAFVNKFLDGTFHRSLAQCGSRFNHVSFRKLSKFMLCRLPHSFQCRTFAFHQLHPFVKLSVGSKNHRHYYSFKKFVVYYIVDLFFLYLYGGAIFMSLTTARIQSVEMHPHQFAEPAIFLFPESG